MHTVWHLGADLPGGRVNGVHNTVWLLAREQAKAGHDVTVAVLGKTPPHAVREAALLGVTLCSVTAILRKLLRKDGPPSNLTIHMHSTFKVEQALIAALLRAKGLAWVVTPHGGISPHVLARGRLKKWSYSALLERRRLMQAAAITVVGDGEQKDVQSYVPSYQGITRTIPNPVELPELVPPRTLPPDRPVVTYMGRLAPWQKGIDRLLELAGHLPEVDFHLYSADTPDALGDIHVPSNVSIFPPVYGPTKWLVLRASSLYIQCSRWEAFGISVAESLGVGVTCVVASEMDMAELVRCHGFGLVLTGTSATDCAAMRALLADPQAIIEMGAQAPPVIQQQFSPARITAQYERLYEDASLRAP